MSFILEKKKRKMQIDLFSRFCWIKTPWVGTENFIIYCSNSVKQILLKPQQFGRVIS